VSWKLVREVLAGAPHGLTAGEWKVLVVVAERANDETRQCYPGLPLLADETNLSEDGVTKAAVARYYAAVADHILPHLRSRPVALLRCPDGLGGQCFYQKHPGGWTPSSLRRVSIREKTKSADYLVIEDAAGLVELIQMGVLEIHTWNAQASRLEAPDRVVFDLDPGPDVPWAAVVAAARLVRATLDGEGLRSFVKTTGGKGLHVVAPITPGPGWSECLDFTSRVVDLLVGETPKAFVGTMAKAARKGKIFIDYFRNQRGATSVAAYSTRARAGAPVSMPITWDELERVYPTDFTLHTVPDRLEAQGDSWAGMLEAKQDLAAVVGASGAGSAA